MCLPSQQLLLTVFNVNCFCLGIVDAWYFGLCCFMLLDGGHDIAIAAHPTNYRIYVSGDTNGTIRLYDGKGIQNTIQYNTIVVQDRSLIQYNTIVVQHTSLIQYNSSTRHISNTIQ